jgi:hypothetical protein
MKAVPKAAVDPTVLPFRPRSLGAARFAKFCERFVKVPKGTGARSPLKLRDWQCDCRPAPTVRRDGNTVVVDGIGPLPIDKALQLAHRIADQATP